MRVTLTAIALCTVLVAGTTKLNAYCDTCNTCNTCAPQVAVVEYEPVCRTCDPCNTCDPCDRGLFGRILPWNW